jgi:hypothetical protein
MRRFLVVLLVTLRVLLTGPSAQAAQYSRKRPILEENLRSSSEVIEGRDGRHDFAREGEFHG